MTWSSAVPVRARLRVASVVTATALLALLVGTSASAAATCFRWYAANQLEETYADPDSACRGYLERHGWNPTGFVYDHVEWSADAPRSGGRCFIAYPASAPQNLFNVAVIESHCSHPQEIAESAASAMCSTTASPAGLQFGNPILPATAEKLQQETDLPATAPGGPGFQRIYRSNRGLDASRPAGPLGKTWSHNHDTVLHIAAPAAASASAAGPATATLTTPEGYSRTFTQAHPGGPWLATRGPDTLGFDGSTFTYRQAQDDSTYRFDARGQLLAHTQRNGWTTTYSHHPGGPLSRITGPFGRSLHLAYDPAGRLQSVRTDDGRTVGYRYDPLGRLWQAIAPDATTRTYLYDNPAFPHALTAILDEHGARFASFAYDTAGRAIATEHAGGVQRYHLSYPAPGQALVTDPLGTTRAYTYATQAGRLVVASASAPATHPGSPAADAARRTQDPASGLVTEQADFLGIRSTTTWDTARRLPLATTEALGTAQERTTTTDWHPRFALPLRITEAGRTTANTYDDHGNLLSQTLTATPGTPGTAGTPGTPSAPRTWHWSYTPQGLVASSTQPNGATTTYAYDPLGQLTHTTDPLGQIQRYTWDPAGRLIEAIAPNGLASRYTWDARGRLLSRTLRGASPNGAAEQTTTFTYHPTGTLASLGLPGGLRYTFSHDPAHRLVGWQNNRGEAGTFTLDALGNRSAEHITDERGAIAWRALRSVDALNRLARHTQGSALTTTYAYDPNGEAIAQTDALNQSTRFGLDPLRRIATLTDAASASAAFGYDAYDHVIQASDFKGIATTYQRDPASPLGAPTHEHSPDIGSRSTWLDALGLPRRIRDALGRTTTVERDLLGRPVRIEHHDPALGASATRTLRLAYARGPGGLGVLERIDDASGSTVYTHDPFGRLTTQRQHLIAGLSQSVAYRYTAGGQLAAITYPSGRELALRYDPSGRLTQLDWDGRPLLTGITWNPLGQPTAWQWAFVRAPGAGALRAHRHYDSAGQPELTEFSRYGHDPAGRITTIAQWLERPADGDPTQSAMAGHFVHFSVGYDPVGRITRFLTSGEVAEYAYDANGNRMRASRRLLRAGLPDRLTTRDYQVEAHSNRIAGFTQAQGSSSEAAPTASTTVHYPSNARGDLLGDGLRQYRYDAQGRLSSVTTGAGDSAPTTRYAYNALGQRVFKTEALYAPVSDEGHDTEGTPRSVLASLRGFFSRTLAAATQGDAERLGVAFVYDQDGSLIAETGTGGAYSTGSTEHIYLPTAGGPMPVAVQIDGQLYAVQSDHLNTPRRLVNADGQAVWQWKYSAFGEDPPTTAATRFADPRETPNAGTSGLTVPRYHLRYPGQYFDEESGLNYNYFRTYDPRSGRYLQADPIGLDGGWNRFGYVGGNPLTFSDPRGLQVKGIRNPLSLLEGGGSGTGNGGGGGLTLGMIGAGAGAWIGSNITGPMLNPDPMMSSGLPPGFWPADKGAEEWGRRNGVNPKEGRRRFHGIKQNCPGSRATDAFGVDPETGDVVDPRGEDVGNLNDVKPK